jgi:antitoxin ParD1/3/4
MTSLNISLPESLKNFVETEVRKGGYSTPSEYVRSLLRDAQKRSAGERLEALLLEGVRSGKAIPGDVVMQRLRKKHRARTKKAM